MRAPLVLLVVTAATKSGAHRSADVVNNRPIIGILSEPRQFPGFHGNSTIAASYVKWIEGAGARVAVVDYTMDATSLRSLLASLNGVLLQGAGERLQFDHPQWMATAGLLFELAKELALPVWGSCFGLQILAVLAAGGNTSVVTQGAFDSIDYMANLRPTAEAKAASSRLWDAMPPEVRATLQSGNATLNAHYDGVTLETMRANAALHAAFLATATSVDRNGREFVSLIEARPTHLDHPHHHPDAHAHAMYASQFHPEKPAYEFAENPNDPHSDAEVAANNWLARFFVGEARRSRRAFPSPVAEQAALIYNYAPIYVAKGAAWPQNETLTQVYFL
jgi:gamma-glutamyl hydrolase